VRAVVSASSAFTELVRRLGKALLAWLRARAAPMHETVPPADPLGVVTPEDRDAVHELFHDLWTQAHDQPDYQRRKWKDLASLLLKYQLVR
jgi:hypothetical protein